MTGGQMVGVERVTSAAKQLERRHSTTVGARVERRAASPDRAVAAEITDAAGPPEHHGPSSLPRRRVVKRRERATLRPVWSGLVGGRPCDLTRV